MWPPLESLDLDKVEATATPKKKRRAKAGKKS